jgi:hypothetical protein
MTLHSLDVFHVRSQPPIRIEGSGVVSEDGLVVVYYCRVDADDRACVEMDSTDICPTLGNNSLERKRNARMTAHRLFDDSLSTQT